MRFSIFFFGFFLVTFQPAYAAITGIWANDGGDKVTREALRLFSGKDVTNSIWNGSAVSLFGAKNEVVSFNLILEAAWFDAQNVSVSFDTLKGPGGSLINSTAASGNGVFTWVGRNIELFYIRYLEIKGLSHDLAYDASYDERHVPFRFRRPWTGEGEGTGGWTERRHHNRFYPDIAVPLELVPQFDISANTNQSIWVDIYIPKTAVAGVYQGTVTIQENGSITQTIQVSLSVHDFTLPDYPSARTMLFYSYENIYYRYVTDELDFDPEDPKEDPNYAETLAIIDRHFQVAHRHKISLIEDYIDVERMNDAWRDRLNGSLFTASKGYDGPGVNVGNNVYSVGTYSSWTDAWDSTSEAEMRTKSNAWVDWFNGHAFTTPTEYFLYLIDEPEASWYPQIEQWAQWLDNNPGSGKALMSMATVSYPDAWKNDIPSVDIPTSGIAVGTTKLWENGTTALVNNPGKRFYYYNGARPASGSFATEDDGVALRVNGWIHHKKKVDRWFYWESTYYDNYQGGQGQTDVFTRAQTYGDRVLTDPNDPSSAPAMEPDYGMGEYGWNYFNGDGVLFYPGTDRVYPSQSYGVKGPFASLRLKHWRRGIQDADYLALAEAVDSAATQAIVQRMVPTVLWEYGEEVEGGGYVYTDIKWSREPDDWESARSELAAIITGAIPSCQNCGGENVIISNREFDGHTNCECTATKSISLRDDVKIRQGANIIFRIEQE